MLKKSIPVLGFILITFIFFWQFLFKGLYPIPADALASLYHPFRDFFSKDFDRGYPFKNFLITDPVLQQYPWRTIATEQIKDKQLPFWNPYSSAGEPLLGNIQAAVMYPLNFVFLFLPFIKGWVLLLMSQIFLGGLFTYLYLRNLKLRKESAFFASSAFMLSGFFFSWMTWNTLLHVAIWLPLILLSVDKLIDISRRRDLVIWSMILIFSLSSSFLAGHLQIFFYGFVLSLIYLIFRRYYIKPKSNRFLIVILISYLLFFLITSLQWFSTFKLINTSSRNVDQMYWETKEGWFVPIQHLIQFIAPDFFGNPVTMNYWGNWNYVELVGYVGLITLCFAIFSILLIKDRTVRFFISALIIALLFALPNFISKIPFNFQIPFISSSQPTRLIYIIDFSLIVLSAYGIELFLKKENKLKYLALICFVVSGLFLAIWIYLLLNSSNPNLLVSQRNFILPTLICVGLLFLIIFAFFFKNKQKIVLVIFYLLLLVNLIDLMRYSLKFNPFVPISLIFPETKITKYLSEESRKYPWRVMGVDYVENQKRVIPPNIGAYYKLYTVDNYNPLLLENYQEYIALSEFQQKDVFNVSFNRMLIPNNYDSRLIDLLGVKYIVAINDTYSDKLKYLFNEGESRVYENIEVFPRAFMVYNSVYAKNPQESISYLFDNKIDLKETAILNKNIKINKSQSTKNKVQFLEYGENSITIEVNTDSEGVLVLTDNYYPGWKVTVDGEEQEIIQTDHTFRGVVVRAGIHIIKFTYNEI